MKNPYFPLFVRDWLCSRRVLSMSGDAVKAYLYLLCESWLQEPRATLPNDDKELASMARMSLSDFTAIKSEIIQHYSVGTCEEHNGRLFQDTLLELSRKSESKQRIGNKNAKKTQNEHKVNAGPEYEYESEITSINSNTKETPLSDIERIEWVIEKGNHCAVRTLADELGYGKVVGGFANNAPDLKGECYRTYLARLLIMLKGKPDAKTSDAVEYMTDLVKSWAGYWRKEKTETKYIPSIANFFNGSKYTGFPE
jgi:uncharacterized protein YdaU (DUF1376 family)